MLILWRLPPIQNSQTEMSSLPVILPCNEQSIYSTVARRYGTAPRNSEAISILLKGYFSTVFDVIIVLFNVSDTASQSCARVASISITTPTWRRHLTYGGDTVAKNIQHNGSVKSRRTWRDQIKHSATISYHSSAASATDSKFLNMTGPRSSKSVGSLARMVMRVKSRP